MTRVAALVLALAVLSVVVAWTCAAHMPLDPKTAKSLHPQRFSMTDAQVEGFGRVRHDWLEADKVVPEPEVFRWGLRPVYRNEPVGAHSVEDSGWPFPCMRATMNCVAYFRINENGRLEGIRYGDLKGEPREDGDVFLLADEGMEGVLAKNSTWRGLGLQPLWFGLLGNVCVYLGVIALGGFLLRLVRSLRAAHRAKRGQCVCCAYPLAGGAVCPECGAPVAPNARTS